MPYWDSALDSQAPELSLIWKFFGGNGDQSANQLSGELQDADGKHYGYCVNDGPFKDVRVVHSQRAQSNLTNEPDCIRRQFGDDRGGRASISSPKS